MRKLRESGYQLSRAQMLPALSNLIMSFLPIVIRELMLASRRPSTYRLRSGVSLVAAVIMLFMVLNSRGPSVQVGSHIFVVLSSAALAYALLSGVRCTADSLSGEKRAGTLGLLFLTNLRGYDVVLGKLIVNSLDAAYGLVAILPILAVPLLLGSVTGSEFWRMNLLLLNSLLFSLMCGLLISTFGKQERGVMIITLFVLLFLTFGLPVLWYAANGLMNSRYVDFLLLPSPAYAFKMVTDSSIRLASQEYHRSMLAMAFLSAVALVVSSVFLPRVYQEKAALPQHRWLQDLARSCREWRFGNTHARGPVAHRLLAHQPFLWLLTRDRLPRFWSLGLAALFAGFAGFIPFLFWTRGQLEGIIVFSSFGAHSLWKVLVAADAARRLNEDKRGGALELLLSTPLPVRAILEGQASSTRSLFALSAVSLAAINLMVLASKTNLLHELGVNYAGGLIMLPLDWLALTWLGMANALREPRYFRSVFRTAASVLGLPWAVAFVFLFAMAPRNESVRIFFVLWLMGSAVFDLALASCAKNRLTVRFRSWAADDFTSPCPAPPPLLPPPIFQTSPMPRRF